MSRISVGERTRHGSRILDGADGVRHVTDFGWLVCVRGRSWGKRRVLVAPCPGAGLRDVRGLGRGGTDWPGIAWGVGCWC